MIAMYFMSRLLIRGLLVIELCPESKQLGRSRHAQSPNVENSRPSHPSHHGVPLSISTTTLSTRRPLLRAGLTAGGAALIAIEAYGALARTLGVPLRAGFPGAHTAQPITSGSLALGVLIATFWGTILAAALAHRATRPARTFTVIAIAFTAISLITPLDAASASTNTRLTLALGHLLVAGIMTTILRSALPTTRRRA
jgi:hypothetical protein